MKHDFLRVAAAVPCVSPADCAANADAIVALVAEARRRGADVVVFPEMCVTGYTCADLFHNSRLLDEACAALTRIAASTAAADSPLVVVGMPVIKDGVMYNCAVAMRAGRVLAVIPKTYIPNYNEFYEKRWWHAAPRDMSTVELCGYRVPFGTRQLLVVGGVRIGVEICEDLWAPLPPGTMHCMAGAEVMLNLSASDDLIGKYDYLLGLIRQQSARCICAYVYASAGYGESSTDLVFDGKAIVAENGRLLTRSERWQHGSHVDVADIDIAALRRDRMHNGTFADCAERTAPDGYVVTDTGNAVHTAGSLLRTVDPHPFVPADSGHLAERCEEIVNIQVAGLCRRLEATRTSKLVIGISGGLDSTLALLVAVRAFDRLGLSRTGIIGVTMPGFGTTDRTYHNALSLMQSLGVIVREIPIAQAVTQHFADIGHDASLHDVTYENSQARERTQILMDIANQVSGMVLGTGDLSELALGWATYNGDHMSMYGVNAGVPKTLVRHLTRYFADTIGADDCRSALLDVIDTPISPELIPAADDGTISQRTEDLVGPYELHDFFLYYMLRYGFAPDRIALLARTAFAGRYDDVTVDRWLRTFMRRFFTQQFKRSCLPDGPKVGSVSLSPRGDWRMPSDASSSAWLR